MEAQDLDVIVIGAGLSGVAAGYHLQTRCPGKRYAILEARAAMGGTWDLFRYPGIRSDSDMATLGFSFRPWTSPNSVAEGGEILQYIRDTAAAFGIDQHIHFGKKVERATWSSAEARWTITVRDVATQAIETWRARFVFSCAGYYRYADGYTPEFADRERFRGTIVHPQHWPDDLDYAGKRVVVIGSGATAVTLVPAMAQKAAHVVMLQRSPTYVLSIPQRDPADKWLRRRLSPAGAHAAVRWKNVARIAAFYNLSRRFPARVSKVLIGQVKRQVGRSVDVKRHFTPRYGPWDQRVCFVPDGDLFQALRDGRASVVTDRIERFTERGLRLESGTELEADIVVTATGLNLELMGGVAIDVDGVRPEPSRTFVYKGMMSSDVPNLGMAVGYTNASWTLKCELTIEYFCRLINHMDQHGYTVCCPRQRDPEVRPEPLIDFSSGYVQRSIDQLPRQGSKPPWKLYQNYALDLLSLRYSSLEDGVMEFGHATPRARAATEEPRTTAPAG